MAHRQLLTIGEDWESLVLLREVDFYFLLKVGKVKGQQGRRGGKEEGSHWAKTHTINVIIWNWRKGNWKQREKKQVLQERLAEGLIQEGEDPETFLFEVPGGDLNGNNKRKTIYEIEGLRNSKKSEKKLKKILEIWKRSFKKILEIWKRSFRENSRSLEENARNLEEKLQENSRNLEEKLLENSRSLEENARSLEEKFLENTEGLKKELCGVANFLEERMGTVETEIDKIREQMNTEVDKMKETISKLEKRINRPSTEMVNENAMLDLSLNLDKVQEELRYGHAHLEHVYHSQLKNRCQKSGESLQEFETEIARLVRLAYPAIPENVMERLAVQAFLDGLRDQETRQALILARPTHLVDDWHELWNLRQQNNAAKAKVKFKSIEEDSQDPANLARCHKKRDEETVT
ncbi:hypothetical protein JTB14_020396 [Gonioctena quinquepunctata]|nr:hypothetical protein JTB14_020396 [Gonioctena quinquepunctata]